jgi:hypothetical protein
VISYPDGERELVAPVSEAEAYALVAHLRVVSPRSKTFRARCELKLKARGATRRRSVALAGLAVTRAS